MAAVPEALPDDAASASPADEKVGRDGEILRAFNFSGGGFNTVMQLGVTHALLVTQGRAPDVVVGVSAGSIQAAALAEVMRKGDKDVAVKKGHELVLGDRVACFRRFVDAAHRAPEDLVDALLPDAYQIDSFDPLAPLGQPTLHSDEREERRRWLVGKAGLARLYNELLGLDIPVGVLAHLARRFLGWRAVGNVGRDNALGGLWRLIAYMSELMKLLLLVSEHLRRFAPLALMFLSPMIGHLYGGSTHHAERDAESIMSRFGVLDRLNRLQRSLWSFLLVLNVWVVLSSLLLMPLVVAIVELLPGGYEVHPGWIVFGAVELALIVSPLLPAAFRGWSSFIRVLANLVRGVTVFAWNSVKWLVATLVLTAAPVLLVAMIGRSLPEAEGALDFYLESTWKLMLLLWAASIPVNAVRFRSRGLHAFLLSVGQAAVLIFLGGLFTAVFLIVTLGVDEVSPPVFAFFGLDIDSLLRLGGTPTLAQQEALGAAEWFSAEQLETAARLGELTWEQRAVLDVLVGVCVLMMSLLVSVGLVAIALVWISLLFVFRASRTIGFYGWFVRRFLDRYQIGASLANGYPLKQFLISLFDTGYYGQTNLVAAADAALSDARAMAPLKRPKGEQGKKNGTTRIEDYARRDANRPPIRLALAAANLGSGKLDVIPQRHGIVDALMATNAFPPLFPPVKLGDKPDDPWYADAINVGTVASRALFRLLRSSRVADIKAVHIYSVDPLPVSQDELSPPIEADGKPKSTPYLNLIDTASRALQLQRFRDAKVERRLTNIFTGLLPEGVASLEVNCDGKPKRFFRAYTAPVELDRPIDLNAQILFAPKEKRRAQLAETVAMGCRAALQVMLAETLASAAAHAISHGERPHIGDKDGEHDKRKKSIRFVSCSKAIALYKANNGGNQEIRLPGSGRDAPGLAEVCKHCCIRNELGEVLEHNNVKAEKSLRILPADETKEILDWPQEVLWQQPAERPLEQPPPEPGEAVVPTPSSSSKAPAAAAKVCLFGGGVFRGVFQMGVLSALAMVKFKPTLVAGASVGSITAAMAAVVLDETKEAEQRKNLADLASVFLSIDRIVLTDRFSDFVRTWTIRASEARFSIREADRVFRKYDFGNAPVFQRTFRAVVAGIERLFYVNPYQLNQLVAAARHRRVEEFAALLKECAQGWLDRMHVGTEVLGAEPLCQLIEQFVINKVRRDLDPEQVVRLRTLAVDAKLLATTTNLTHGRLRILGAIDDRNVNLTLLETLLASSAFPGVFRPRRSWDLFPGESNEDEYVDGGIVDNLPLDPVLQELRSRAEKPTSDLEIRPKFPHLLIAASLEPGQRTLSAEQTETLATHWPDLRARLRELQYNVKLDMYKYGLDDVSAVFDEVQRQGKGSPREPLKVKLVAVEPKWLCSTFAFHPMLGFRRTHQAKSIAHGCATTLCSLAEIRDGADEKWGLDESAIPRHGLKEALREHKGSSRFSKAFRDGMCWLLPEKRCPFAKSGEGSEHKDSAHWVAEIHRHCWDRKTHSPQAVV